MRPPYGLENYAWPLIEFMADEGLTDSVCVATDMVIVLHRFGRGCCRWVVQISRLQA